MFSNKEKRQLAKQAEEEAIIEGGKVTLNLGGNAKNQNDGKR